MYNNYMYVNSPIGTNPTPPTPGLSTDMTSSAITLDWRFVPGEEWPSPSNSYPFGTYPGVLG